MKVDTAREQRDRHFSRAREGEVVCEREDQSSSSAESIVANCRIRGTSAPAANQTITKWRNAELWCGNRKLPQSDAGGIRDRTTAKESNGKKKKGSNTGTRTARRAYPTAGENQKNRKSIANSRQDMSIANSRQTRAKPTAGKKIIEDLEEDGKD